MGKLNIRKILSGTINKGTVEYIMSDIEDYIGSTVNPKKLQEYFEEINSSIEDKNTFIKHFEDLKKTGRDILGDEDLTELIKNYLGGNTTVESLIDYVSDSLNFSSTDLDEISSEEYEDDDDIERVGPGGHVPDGSGPHGLGDGPGEGKADGSGLEEDDLDDTEEVSLDDQFCEDSDEESFEDINNEEDFNKIKDNLKGKFKLNKDIKIGNQRNNKMDKKVSFSKRIIELESAVSDLAKIMSESFSSNLSVGDTVKDSESGTSMKIVKNNENYYLLPLDSDDSELVGPFDSLVEIEDSVESFSSDQSDRISKIELAIADMSKIMANSFSSDEDSKRFDKLEQSFSELTEILIEHFSDDTEEDDSEDSSDDDSESEDSEDDKVVSEDEAIEDSVDEEDSESSGEEDEDEDDDSESSDEEDGDEDDSDEESGEEEEEESYSESEDEESEDDDIDSKVTDSDVKKNFSKGTKKSPSSTNRYVNIMTRTAKR